jgi:hypothetical protein
MQFDGPTTILIQSRGPRLNDVLSGQEVNEIAGTPRGLSSGPYQASEVEKTGSNKSASYTSDLERSVEQLEQEIRGTSLSVAKIRKDGKVEIEEVSRN